MKLMKTSWLARCFANYSASDHHHFFLVVVSFRITIHLCHLPAAANYDLVASFYLLLLFWIILLPILLASLCSSAAAIAIIMFR